MGPQSQGDRREGLQQPDQQGPQSDGGRAQMPQMRQPQQGWQGSDRKDAAAPAAKHGPAQAHARPGNGQGHSMDAAAGLPNGAAQLPEAGYTQQGPSVNLDVPPNIAPQKDRGMGQEPHQTEGRHTGGPGKALLSAQTVWTKVAPTALTERQGSQGAFEAAIRALQPSTVHTTHKKLPPLSW